MANEITKRMNYFDRQFLRAKDFQDEQAFHIESLRRHNRTLHSSGVVEGFLVTGKKGENQVNVGPGIAIAKNGSEIVLGDSIKFKIPAELNQGNMTINIYIRNTEVLTDSTSEGDVIRCMTRIIEQPEIGYIRNGENLSDDVVSLAFVKLDQGKLENNVTGLSSTRPPISFESKIKVEENGNMEIYGSMKVTSMSTRTGEKPGYVIDYVINADSSALEQGDVVVIGDNPAPNYWASGNNIPIPEVYVTTAPYNSRVCGIVAEAVTKDDLPYASPISEHNPEIVSVEGEVLSLTKHPLEHLALSSIQQPDRTKVHTKKMGKMVTMGAYACCKVDADFGEIKMGDLLTTSPTKGHAQRVDDRDKVKAIGAIIGKALGPLKEGKGIIPILVMLQ